MLSPRFRCGLVLLVASLISSVSISLAQAPQVTFVDVPFADALVMTLPQDWLVWDREEFVTGEAAELAAVNLMRSVYPVLNISTPFVTPNQELLALPPIGPADGIVRADVEVHDAEALAQQVGVTPADITTNTLLRSLGATVLSNVGLNDRTASFGTLAGGLQTEFIGVYRFPDPDRIAVLTLETSPTWIVENQDIAMLLLLSLRREGEAADLSSYQTLAGFSLPGRFQLPEGMTPPPPFPEPTAAPIQATAPSKLAPELAASVGLACPEGTSEIAFASGPEGERDIYLMNVDGTNIRRLTNSFGDNVPTGWSPDGTRLYFHSGRNGVDADVYVMNADGSSQRQLTDNTIDDYTPHPSPDGRLVAFTRFPTRGENEADLYLMGVNGGETRRLTNLTGAELWPVWGPDGTNVTFVGILDGQTDLYVLNGDGTYRRLTDDAVADGPGYWSPDGRQILFWSQRGGSADLYVMDAFGGNVRQVTNAPGEDYAGNGWSPDSRYIVFTSNRAGDGQFDIYLMPVAGGEAVRLTDNLQDDLDPHWRPCPPRAQCRLEAPNGVNLRGGPTTNDDIEATFRAGGSVNARAQVTGSDGYTWYQVTGGLWVRSDVVRTEGDCGALPVLNIAQ